MVYVLGVNLPDHHLVKFALTSFYGIGHHTAARICARFQMHNTCKVRDLSPMQVTALASFLSSPKDSLSPLRFPTATPDFTPSTKPHSELLTEFRAQRAKREVDNKKPEFLLRRLRDRRVLPDKLKELKIEAELRQVVRENIAHQKMIGSYVGRRHAMGLPVRGQTTQNNAKTAKKLNRVERWA
ncbi:General amino acid permease [Mycena indigotica]|uniref:Small ribosomal subunit protein uS13m n=1 Tax=Mycena indigotica TaxID=2126181 RepID=A0A8H6VUV3_9AGAR|nr:General amino acid permease [Mycena indigotica]KAF7294779.1 General amino acid permease [Mycena indigotica]